MPPKRKRVEVEEVGDDGGTKRRATRGRKGVEVEVVVPVVRGKKGKSVREVEDEGEDDAFEGSEQSEEEPEEEEFVEEKPKKKRRTAVSRAPKTAAPKSAHKTNSKSAASKKTTTTRTKGKGKAKATEPIEEQDGEEDEDEEMDWEDCLDPSAPASTVPQQTGDLELTLDKPTTSSTQSRKKGPNPAARQFRLSVHCMHVQCLLYHGWIRNKWCTDAAVQSSLLEQLGKGMLEAVERYKEQVEVLENEKEAAVEDPLVTLVGPLMKFWKKRYTVEGEGLRRFGYPPEGVEIKYCGESLEGRKELVKKAEEARGSRDIGAQLFTSLLRAVGIETRLIFSLQTLGFGFSKDENYVDETEEGKSKEPSKSRARTDPPVFWSEVFSPFTKTWYPVDAIMGPKLIADTSQAAAYFTPKATSAQAFSYIIAYDSSNSAKDVTVRYLRNHIFPGKTKGKRILPTEVPLYDTDGNVIKTLTRDWFSRVLRLYQAPPPTSPSPFSYASLDVIESDLIPQTAEKKQTESIAGYKSHPDLVLEQHLHQNEALPPDAKPVRDLTLADGTTLPLFSRKDILIVKSAATWYHIGRAVIPESEPLKLLTKKNASEPVALYSEAQTTLFTHPPVSPEDPLPRNTYGDIDLFAPHMLPPGTAHVTHPCAKVAAKKIGLDFVPAVTGFEGHGRRRVPTVQGVVVRECDEGMLRDACVAEERGRREREGKKRSKEALARWAKWFAKLKVLARVRREYGIPEEDVDVEEVDKMGDTSSGMQEKEEEKEESDADSLDSEGDISVEKQSQTSESETAASSSQRKSLFRRETREGSFDLNQADGSYIPTGGGFIPSDDDEGEVEEQVQRPPLKGSPKKSKYFKR